MLYETPFEKHQREEKEVPQQVSTRYEWASAVKARIANNPRDTHASTILRWHYVEDRKRKNGEINEIDIAEIKAALKGVRNTWFGCVEKHKEKITNLLDEEPMDWKMLLELKAEKN